ncbi:MarR family winged helix-turn-helix transcriptional regulator [Photobacterium atrarenae]|uniref:MarR family transcriptional regulator n=1 Tax=Photobacterium atrarenae TaxID=865757 RepID=A0ABY5GL67_9GAMM|nr:MarR family transcriptional regulator [Photobacterium atrarenae]UTV29469.1 MarR family transcriptional regulator [Photobacterium atrarenae]
MSKLDVKPENGAEQTNLPADAVDAIISQWQNERPDLSLGAMATFGRLKRCSVLSQPMLDNTFSKFGLSGWEFDVLATLRRSGAPYRLAPTTLFSTLMITSGTMTHRMKRLESSGLIERLPNPNDARSMLVQLTDKGLDLIEKAVSAHVNNMESRLEALDATQKAKLDEGLKVLLSVLES